MKPFFLAAGDGRASQRWCVLHEPAQPARALVVHLHAFAEEMNKSRRMVALQARALREQGAVVLLIDLLGCGDSSGESVDVSWDDWHADVDLAVSFLQSRWDAPLWLWGHRAGCLLATAAAARHRSAQLLLWQPPTSGKTVLQNFLRLKLAGQLSVAEGGGKRVIDELRHKLSCGQPIEIAGYGIAPELAAGLERATLEAGDGSGRRVEWLEVAARDQPELLPASAAGLGHLREAGWAVRSRAVQGPAFWQTTDVEVAPALLVTTSQALLDGV